MNKMVPHNLTPIIPDSPPILVFLLDTVCQVPSSQSFVLITPSAWNDLVDS